MLDRSFEQKAFISYSRKDGLEFTEQLAAALEVVGVQPIIDRHSISAGEDWRNRISSLIAEADAMVFVITPESVASEICEWEITKSDQLSKRIIPVIPKLLTGVSLPERFRSLNHVFFYPDVSVPGAGFGSGLADLSAALRTDINWVRTHTRYGQRASEWLAGNRAINRLLSGSDITTAKTWVAERQASAPEITDEMRDFFDASEQADNDRRNIEQQRLREKEESLVQMDNAQKDRDKAQRRAKRFLLGGFIFSITLAVLAGWMWQQAKISEERGDDLLELVGWIGNRDLNGKLKLPEKSKYIMIELCDDAIGITKRIGKNQNSEDTEKFWKLYFGALYVVEQYQKEYLFQITIEVNMVDFGKILEKKKEGSLVYSAKQVENACDTFKKTLLNSM